MDDLKTQLQRKIIGTMLVSECANSENVIFRDAWCTQERVIRFKTSFFKDLFQDEKEENIVMYEAYNNIDSLIVKCSLFKKKVLYKHKDVFERLLRAAVPQSHDDEKIILKEWDFSGKTPNESVADFSDFLKTGIHNFENEIKSKLSDESEDNADSFREGEIDISVHRTYERNRKAREACIAAKGTACTVCGIDFGKDYGEEFSGKIEVHHITPISSIGHDYKVDPIKDLVPVCPNCHMALHSKKGGVYTIEELKKIRSKNN